MTARDIFKGIRNAVKNRDRDTASSLLKGLGNKIDQLQDLEEQDVLDGLSRLRSEKWFDELDTVSAIARKSGMNTPKVRRHLAKGLLENKKFDKALSILDSVLDDTNAGDKEHSRALGLLGQTYKQLYIDNSDGDVDVSQESLIRNAAKRYRQGLELNFDFRQRARHGINLAAVLHKSQEDGLSIGEAGEWRTIAAGLLDEISARSDDDNKPSDPFEYATAGEAALALNEPETAEYWFNKYRDSDPGEFRLAATVRQLRELWGKKLENSKNGGMLLRLQAQAAKTENEGVTFAGDEILVAQSLASDTNMLFPQGRVNDAEFTTVHWLVAGLDRGKAVIRLGKTSDRGVGTGFVVSKMELLGDAADDPQYSKWPEYVAITNAHVTTEDEQTRLEAPEGPTGSPLYHSIEPSRLTASFQTEHAILQQWPKQYRVKQLYSSPFLDLDTTILMIEGWNPPDGFKPCPISTRPPTKHTKRILVVGHPSGNSLMYSMEGSKYLGHSHEPQKPDPSQLVAIRYTSPTEGGSSGSPVFEDENWEVVGVHQGMITTKTNNQGEAAQSANQAIWIDSIRHRLAN